MVQGQPVQKVNESLSQQTNWARCFMCVISAMWKAELGGLLPEVNLDKSSNPLSKNKT
jgi:hypothetical protein